MRPSTDLHLFRGFKDDFRIAVLSVRHVQLEKDVMRVLWCRQKSGFCIPFRANPLLIEIGSLPVFSGPTAQIR